jgi:uncharacterized protein HemX
MQPDLLTAQEEEEQSPTFPPQHLTQPEPAPVAELIEVKPAPPPQKKRAKLNIAAITLAFLVFVLFLALGWVGYWAFTLNTELTTTHAQFAALQAEHSQLQKDFAALTSDHEKLNADLTQSKTDLEKTNADLTTAQADLSESQEKAEKLEAKIDTADSLAEIFYIMAVTDDETVFLKVDRLVTATKDKELMKRWDAVTGSPTPDSMGAFLEYLATATRNSLR